MNIRTFFFHLLDEFAVDFSGDLIPLLRSFHFTLISQVWHDGGFSVSLTNANFAFFTL